MRTLVLLLLSVVCCLTNACIGGMYEHPRVGPTATLRISNDTPYPVQYMTLQNPEKKSIFTQDRTIEWKKGVNITPSGKSLEIQIPGNKIFPLVSSMLIFQGQIGSPAEKKIDCVNKVSFHTEANKLYIAKTFIHNERYGHIVAGLKVEEPTAENTLIKVAESYVHQHTVRTSTITFAVLADMVLDARDNKCKKIDVH